MGSKKIKNSFIVIPAFNESNAIGDVITDLHKYGFEKIIVVDDGSFDNTYDVARKSRCIALHHQINRGKGAATQTGLDAAKLLGAELVITMDGDGQHYPEDAQELLKILQEQDCDVVIGSRLKGQSGLPFTRRIINLVGNCVTYLFYGVLVSDSQSGFRSYNRKALMAIDSQMDRYEFESDSLSQLKKAGCVIAEIPIKVQYTEHSLTKYNKLSVPGQNLANGFKMLFRMIIRSIFA